jgi:hypothetical protein
MLSFRLLSSGKQRTTTKVDMMAPAEHEAITLDVVDYMWEKCREMVRTWVLHSSCERWIADSILSGPAIILRTGARP